MSTTRWYEVYRTVDGDLALYGPYTSDKGVQGLSRPLLYIIKDTIPDPVPQPEPVTEIIDCRKKEDDGWIPWSGGERPVPKDTFVRCRLRNQGELYLRAGDFDWNNLGDNHDIIAYKVDK